MKNDFQLLRLMVDELNSTNSTNDKRDILSKYDDEFIKLVIYYTYNPTFQYYVTPENLEKNYSNDLGKVVKYSDLFELLDALKSRSITGHLAINSVNDFCYDNEKYKDLIYKVIGKDLEIRMGDSLINKVFPGLIPTFDCALATDFDKVQVDFAKDTFFASRKLDGVRCLAVVDDMGAVTLWSRQGNQFLTLEKVEKEIASIGMRDVVFDGEICLVDALGNEDFVLKNTIKIHPNPTQTQVTIEANELTNASLEITDINGRTLKTQKLDVTNSINIEYLKAGVYLFKITSNEGTSTQRVIKN